MRMSILLTCMYTICTPGEKSEGGIGPPGTGVIDGCEPPCGYWKQYLGPLQKQLTFLTVGLDPQPPVEASFGYSKNHIS